VRHYHLKKRNMNKIGQEHRRNLAKNIEETWPRTSKKLGQNLAKTSKESSKFLAKFFKVLGKVLRSSWPSFSIFFQRNFEFLFEWFESTKSFSKMRTFPDPPVEICKKFSTKCGVFFNHLEISLPCGCAYVRANQTTIRLMITIDQSKCKLSLLDSVCRQQW
jgi:hypothetical protein